jgi:DNA-binding MarR family transcriptional regulator
MEQAINKKISEIIFNLYRLMKKNFETIKKNQLTMIQLHGLIFIKDNKDCQLTDLAKAFSITLPTANSLVEKLLSLKLIKKNHDKKDQRAIKLLLTKKGEKLIKGLLKEKEKCFSTLINKLDQKEKEQLLIIFKKIIS